MPMNALSRVVALEVKDLLVASRAHGLHSGTPSLMGSYTPASAIHDVDGYVQQYLPILVQLFPDKVDQWAKMIAATIHSLDAIVNPTAGHPSA